VALLRYALVCAVDRWCGGLVGGRVGGYALTLLFLHFSFLGDGVRAKGVPLKVDWCSPRPRPAVRAWALAWWSHQLALGEGHKVE